MTVTDVLVSQANQLLGASYRLYRNTKTNETIIRTVGYALPAALHTHIQAVAPTTYFPSMKVKRKTLHRRSFDAAASEKLVRALSSRDSEITPSHLHRMYNTFPYIPAATDKNALGVVGLQDQYPSQEDLDEFMTDYYTDAEGATFAVEKVNGGGDDPNNPGYEASTDIQYAEAMVYPKIGRAHV